MATRTSLRPSVVSCSLPKTQVRHATLLKRPKRPWTFTQMVTLSDGSTFLHRTTSPQPIYRSTKDVRNTALWNPSSQKLANIEEDEAGRLARFRERFGRGWDSESTKGLDEEVEKQEAQERIQDESLLDLIGNDYESNSGASKQGSKKKAKK
ncbi:54S ribosomal protein L36, mitochondrial [Sphaceloma murrayae]|uniref:54S ribosomal protein L36, mitochondrial n=1 Tax=Sphaceloma murrayae TaxID=2082308 RepID=A0A2K1R276_9PEZI|nr:54S ribosomal protein L36, mitochondrial [Sphaceloma murrayae]